ncbi:MAG: proline--tRNA ligase [Simkaniaceae bacterium]|nr:proline--tRNA ligase [Simkaniaceae bacterium]
MKKQKTAITPIREENYPEWYQQVIKAADLAEHSPVRGCMVIKPWGYAIWENIQRILDRKFKELGHENAYFPLFIPLSYMQREAKHVEGFATECAVVTHHRLEKNKEGELVPAGPLEEPLIVRPTSEMMVGEMFSKWIESYRDLPILMNQWSNIVRWEMRTRLFLRTTEILWQEGHTAHATKEEAEDHTRLMLDTYVDFIETYLAVPLIKGIKTETEKFPGADSTYTFEAMMQDGKALQAGTSHFLGQNFSKAGNITFRDQEGKEQFAWTTSWGVTTRLIGALIMTHSDDDGLVLPPRIASSQIVLIPIVHKPEMEEEIFSYCDNLAKELRTLDYAGTKLNVRVDKRDIRGGAKVWDWVKKGVPIRIEIGPKEIQENRLSVTKRTRGHREFFHQSKEELLKTVISQLEEMQQELFDSAKAFRDRNTFKIDTKEDFYAFFKDNKYPHGFALCHFSEDPKVEEQVQKDLNVTVRCVPLDAPVEEGKCVISGEKSMRRVIFARSY